MSNKVRDVLVVGAGTMGNGIAQVFAQADCSVVLYDISQESIDRGMLNIKSMLTKAVDKGKMDNLEKEKILSQISTMTDLSEACRGKSLVIEAAPEDMALKKNIFTNIELATSEDTLIATNTSSLSITEISESLSYPSRFIGLHFFNPVPLMPLLEVVLGKETSDFAREQALEISKVIGKEPILVNDVPGFASSRLGVCIGLEAMRMFGEGVASAEDIDKAMELGYRHPMGPLKLTDLVGLDVRLGIAEYLAEQLGPRFEPPQILKDMVAQGKLGKKSGEGFYQW